METGQTNSKRLSQPFKGLNTDQAMNGRIQYLKELGMNTECLENSFLNASQVKSNIESYIGTLQMPMGLVGPITMEEENGEYKQFFTAAATTEGALVASMNRGASIISACGGFKAHVQKQLMLRAPFFCFEDLYQAKKFAQWISSKTSELATYVKNYSKRAELVEIKTSVLGRNVDCKFYYKTADAAGQNMTTICTWHSCLWIEDHFNKEHDFKIQEFVLEGNGAGDKKLSHTSLINGRGIDVVAECIIDEEILQKRLKVTSEKMLKWFNISYQLTSADGMIGNNINVANAIAAIFASTGQDMACIAESAVGYLQLEKHPRGLYFSLKLPKLVIGTVGGGTGLPHQKSILELMDCYGPGKVNQFAKLIAGFSLGLEISTMSAMVSGQFAIAHERLGRNKPVNFLNKKELTSTFFQQNILSDENQFIQFVDDLSDHNGIVTQISAQNTNKFIGLSLWGLEKYNDKNLVVLKSKPTDKETLNCMYVLTGLIDPALAKSFMRYQDKSDFNNCHAREIEIYRHLKNKDSHNIPTIYGLYSNDERESYLVLMEFFQEQKLRVFNSELNPDKWTDQDLKNSIKAANKLYDDLKDLSPELVSSQTYADYSEFAKHSIMVLEIEYGHRYKEITELFKRAIKYLESNEQQILNTFEVKTIHNDFNPRNIAISDKDEVKIYDWELATKDIVHRDLLELLLFTSSSKNINSDIKTYFEFQHQLESSNMNYQDWQEGYRYALAKFLVTRMNLYLLGNKISSYPFIKILLENILKINETYLKL